MSNFRRQWQNILADYKLCNEFTRVVQYNGAWRVYFPPFWCIARVSKVTQVKQGVREKRKTIYEAIFKHRTLAKKNRLEETMVEYYFRNFLLSALSTLLSFENLYFYEIHKHIWKYNFKNDTYTIALFIQLCAAFRIFYIHCISCAFYPFLHHRISHKCIKIRT